MRLIRGCLFQVWCLLEEIWYFYKTLRSDTHMTSTLQGAGEGGGVKQKLMLSDKGGGGQWAMGGSECFGQPIFFY